MAPAFGGGLGTDPAGRLAESTAAYQRTAVAKERLLVDATEEIEDAVVALTDALQSAAAARGVLTNPVDPRLPPAASDSAAAVAAAAARARVREAAAASPPRRYLVDDIDGPDGLGVGGVHSLVAGDSSSGLAAVIATRERLLMKLAAVETELGEVREAAAQVERMYAHVVTWKDAQLAAARRRINVLMKLVRKEVIATEARAQKRRALALAAAVAAANAPAPIGGPSPPGTTPSASQSCVPAMARRGSMRRPSLNASHLKSATLPSGAPPPRRDGSAGKARTSCDAKGKDGARAVVGTVDDCGPDGAASPHWRRGGAGGTAASVVSTAASPPAVSALAAAAAAAALARDGSDAHGATALSHTTASPEGSAKRAGTATAPGSPSGAATVTSGKAQSPLRPAPLTPPAAPDPEGDDADDGLLDTAPREDPRVMLALGALFGIRRRLRASRKSSSNTAAIDSLDNLIAMLQPQQDAVVDGDAAPGLPRTGSAVLAAAVATRRHLVDVGTGGAVGAAALRPYEATEDLDHETTSWLMQNFLPLPRRTAAPSAPSTSGGKRGSRGSIDPDVKASDPQAAAAQQHGAATDASMSTATVAGDGAGGGGQSGVASPVSAGAAASGGASASVAVGDGGTTAVAGTSRRSSSSPTRPDASAVRSLAGGDTALRASHFRVSRDDSDASDDDDRLRDDSSSASDDAAPAAGTERVGALVSAVDAASTMDLHGAYFVDGAPGEQLAVAIPRMDRFDSWDFDISVYWRLLGQSRGAPAGNAAAVAPVVVPHGGVADALDTLERGVHGTIGGAGPVGPTRVNRILSIVTMNAFKKHHLLSRLSVPEKALWAFLRKCDERYRPQNPYHFSLHAADVVHGVHVMLTTSGMHRYCTALEVFAVIFAAAVHDLEHPGKNNAFLCTIRHPIALRYNDTAVLEGHHIAAAFTLLHSDPQFDFTRDWPAHTYATFRRMVVSFVLGTDMAGHFRDADALKSRIADGATRLGDEDARHFLLRTLLHAADVSNPSRPQALYIQWTHRVLEEFWAQGAEERRRGLPISPMCDRHQPNVAKGQLGFINFIVKPTFVLLNTAISGGGIAAATGGPRASPLAEMLQHLDDNAAYWLADVSSPIADAASQGGTGKAQPMSNEQRFIHEHAAVIAADVPIRMHNVYDPYENDADRCIAGPPPRYLSPDGAGTVADGDDDDSVDGNREGDGRDHALRSAPLPRRVPSQTVTPAGSPMACARVRGAAGRTLGGDHDAVDAIGAPSVSLDVSSGALDSHAAQPASPPLSPPLSPPPTSPLDPRAPHMAGAHGAFGGVASPGAGIGDRRRQSVVFAMDHLAGQAVGHARGGRTSPTHSIRSFALSAATGSVVDGVTDAHAARLAAVARSLRNVLDVGTLAPFVTSEDVVELKASFAAEAAAVAERLVADVAATLVELGELDPPIADAANGAGVGPRVISGVSRGVVSAVGAAAAERLTGTSASDAGGASGMDLVSASRALDTRSPMHSGGDRSHPRVGALAATVTRSRAAAAARASVLARLARLFDERINLLIRDALHNVRFAGLMHTYALEARPVLVAPEMVSPTALLNASLPSSEGPSVATSGPAVAPPFWAAERGGTLHRTFALSPSADVIAFVAARGGAYRVPYHPLRAIATPTGGGSAAQPPRSYAPVAVWGATALPIAVGDTIPAAPEDLPSGIDTSRGSGGAALVTWLARIRALPRSITSTAFPSNGLLDLPQPLARASALASERPPTVSPATVLVSNASRPASRATPVAPLAGPQRVSSAGPVPAAPPPDVSVSLFVRRAPHGPAAFMYRLYHVVLDASPAVEIARGRHAPLVAATAPYHHVPTAAPADASGPDTSSATGGADTSTGAGGGVASGAAPSDGVQSPIGDPVGFGRAGRAEVRAAVLASLHARVEASNLVILGTSTIELPASMFTQGDEAAEAEDLLASTFVPSPSPSHRSLPPVRPSSSRGDGRPDTAGTQTRVPAAARVPPNAASAAAPAAASVIRLSLAHVLEVLATPSALRTAAPVPPLDIAGDLLAADPLPPDPEALSGERTTTLAPLPHAYVVPVGAIASFRGFYDALGPDSEGCIVARRLALAILPLAQRDPRYVMHATPADGGLDGAYPPGRSSKVSTLQAATMVIAPVDSRVYLEQFRRLVARAAGVSTASCDLEAVMLTYVDSLAVMASLTSKL